MSKRNITYVKPEEPSFLRRIKEQVGYKEGPTVDTKVGCTKNTPPNPVLTSRTPFQREDLGPVEEDDLRDADDERPTVVVLNPGDLTEEEAARVNRELEKGETLAVRVRR